MNDLVKRLSEGDHAVEVSLRPEPSLKAFRDMLGRQYVLIRFTETRGGTELGFPVDKSRSDFTKANLEKGTGHVHLAGELTLDYVPVRCVADIDVASLKGHGRLEIR